VIVLDRSVLSAVLRRRRKGDAEEALAARLAAVLKSDERVAIPGIVLQELLIGIAEKNRVSASWRPSVRAFP